MNSVLSGTGWGEMPERELEIPWFMYAVREEKRFADEREAETAAAVSRERRKIRAKRRAEEKRKKNNAIAAVVVFGTAGLLILVNLIVEMMV